MRFPSALVALCVAWASLAAAETTGAQSYTIEVTLYGLIGYVNTPNEVWALLPDASPGAALPPGVGSDNSFPRHFAYLRVAGRNVQGVSGGDELLIPLKGYDVLPQFGVPENPGGLPAGPFRQPADDPVDRLAPLVLTSPGQVAGLAARVRLPRGDLTIESSSEPYGNVRPVRSGPACVDPGVPRAGDGTRVEGVRWTTTLTEPLAVDFSHYQDPTKDYRLRVVPARGESTVKLEIVNQVSEALVNVNFQEMHFEPYRWFYGLSADPGDCTGHYYPSPAQAGGKRCPQKLFQTGD